MKKLIIVIMLVFLVGCTSGPISAPTSTPEPTPTTTPAPTPTPDLSADRTLIADALREWCKDRRTTLKQCEVTWEEDELKIKGYVAGYPEPSDHTPIQFDFLSELANVAKLGSITGFPGLLRDTDKIIIVSEGLLSEISMLSETTATTFTRIINNKITTRAEWLSEAQIVQ